MSAPARRGSARDVAVAPGMSDMALAGGGRAYSDRNDPWRAVLSLGDRSVKLGGAIGLVLAIGTHGFASARAMLALYDMQRGVDEMRMSIHEFLWTEYDVDLKPPEEKKAEPEKKDDPPPPPEPDPEPIPQPVAKTAEPPKDPYEDQKAAPVQAAKILTAAPDPNEVKDLTDQGIVSGENTAGPLGGQSSAEGKSDKITHNANVSLTGKPGGTGSGDTPPPPPPPKPDLSRAPSLIGGTSWNCPFPDEADTDQVDYAQVSVVITVRPDGSPQSAQVAADPGHGFGRAARMCALGRRFNPGLDRDGNPATVSMTVRITFSR